MFSYSVKQTDIFVNNCDVTLWCSGGPAIALRWYYGMGVIASPMCTQPCELEACGRAQHGPAASAPAHHEPQQRTRPLAGLPPKGMFLLNCLSCLTKIQATSRRGNSFMTVADRWTHCSLETCSQIVEI